MQGLNLCKVKLYFANKIYKLDEQGSRTQIDMRVASDLIKASRVVLEKMKKSYP